MLTWRGRTEEEQKKFDSDYDKTYKASHKKEYKIYRDIHKKEIYEKTKNWLVDHPHYKAEYKRDWYRKKVSTEEGKRYQKNRKLFNDYKITIEDYEKLLEKQENKCACCGIDFKFVKQVPYVDHNHETGKVRGILCFNCNAGIGMFHDDVLKLQKSIEYLIRTQG